MRTETARIGVHASAGYYLSFSVHLEQHSGTSLRYTEEGHVTALLRPVGNNLKGGTVTA